MELFWNEEKNEFLKKTRKISFEMAKKAIAKGDLAEIVDHPNQKKYPGQRVFLIEIDGYMHCVPFIKTQDGRCFLKTMFRSRKINKYFKRRGYENKNKKI